MSAIAPTERVGGAATPDRGPGLRCPQPQPTSASTTHYVLAGWVVLRISWTRLGQDWPGFVAELRGALRQAAA